MKNSYSIAYEFKTVLKFSQNTRFYNLLANHTKDTLNMNLNFFQTIIQTTAMPKNQAMDVQKETYIFFSLTAQISIAKQTPC